MTTSRSASLQLPTLPSCNRHGVKALQDSGTHQTSSNATVTHHHLGSVTSSCEIPVLALCLNFTPVSCLLSLVHFVLLESHNHTRCCWWMESLGPGAFHDTWIEFDLVVADSRACSLHSTSHGTMCTAGLSSSRSWACQQQALICTASWRLLCCSTGCALMHG